MLLLARGVSESGAFTHFGLSPILPSLTQGEREKGNSLRFQHNCCFCTGALELAAGGLGVEGTECVGTECAAADHHKAFYFYSD